MEDEPQLDTVLRAIDNNTWHAKGKRKKEMVVAVALHEIKCKGSHICWII